MSGIGVRLGLHLSKLHRLLVVTPSAQSLAVTSVEDDA